MAPAPPPKLDKGVARSAAQQAARRFVNRNRRLDSTSFKGCHRKARQHVNCNYRARGQTSSRRTTCRFRVAVEGTDGNHSTRVGHVRCRTEPRRVLSYGRAKQAIRDAAERLADKPVPVEVNRVSKLKFWGWTEWTRRPLDSTTAESCYAELIATMQPTGRLRVASRNLECEEVTPVA